jgi:pimeloyl-ACP methyl ester carboxylesterase
LRFDDFIYTPTKGELLQFKTKDGLVLEGFLVRPKNAKLCIIYVHGWGGNFYRELAVGLARGMSKRGIAIFSINTRGHDTVALITRMIGRKRASFNGGVELEKFEDSALDIEGAIDGLKRLGFKKFVLCGHSTGSQKITYYQLRKINKSVIGLILVAPGDDYNIWRKEILGKSFNEKRKTAKALVAKGKGDQLNFIEDSTPKRFLSVADLKNVEARLFNYDGELKEFSKIRIPVLVLFGSKEEHAIKPVNQYLKILEEKSNSKLFESHIEKSNSKLFESHIVKGAMHRFYGHEDEVADLISNFVSKLQY